MPDNTRATHVRWADLPREQVTPQLARRLVTGEHLMLAQVYLEKGTIVPQHRHHNEQLTWILEGALRFWLG
ncbi:MAG: cupin domain-containing protein, partial [Gemmatimonadaceae bacterium]|nr:cupin domain-containing protein [Gemmatimonadaceae bacterium]